MVGVLTTGLRQLREDKLEEGSGETEAREVAMV